MKMYVGINFADGKDTVNREFNPETAFDAAKIMGELLLDEKAAINFIFTVVREDSNDSKQE